MERAADIVAVHQAASQGSAIMGAGPGHREPVAVELRKKNRLVNDATGDRAVRRHLAKLDAEREIRSFRRRGRAHLPSPNIQFDHFDGGACREVPAGRRLDSRDRRDDLVRVSANPFLIDPTSPATATAALRAVLNAYYYRLPRAGPS